MGKTALAVIAPAETAIGSPSTTARRLVRDAFQRTFEVSVLITNDSDLSEPVRIVRQELNLPVGIHPERTVDPELMIVHPMGLLIMYVRGDRALVTG